MPTFLKIMFSVSLKDNVQAFYDYGIGRIDILQLKAVCV
jgi:hypothetical protein